MAEQYSPLYVCVCVCVYVYIYVPKYFWINVSVFLGYILSSGIAGSYTSSLFSSCVTSILFSIVAAPICIPSDKVQGFPFLHNLPSKLLLLIGSLMTAILTGVRWYHTMVLICIYLIISPRILEWVACPFSSRSSQSRNWTRVSCIAGRFFTNWTIRESPQLLAMLNIFSHAH